MLSQRTELKEIVLMCLSRDGLYSLRDPESGRVVGGVFQCNPDPVRTAQRFANDRLGIVRLEILDGAGKLVEARVFAPTTPPPPQFWWLRLSRPA